MISFLCETYIMFPVSGTNFMFLVLLNLQIPKNCGFIKKISVILQNKTKTNPNNNILLQEKFQNNKTLKYTESTLKISFKYVSSYNKMLLFGLVFVLFYIRLSGLFCKKMLNLGSRIFRPIFLSCNTFLYLWLSA